MRELTVSETEEVAGGWLLNAAVSFVSGLAGTYVMEGLGGYSGVNEAVGGYLDGWAERYKREVMAERHELLPTIPD